MSKTVEMNEKSSYWGLVMLVVFIFVVIGYMYLNTQPSIVVQEPKDDLGDMKDFVLKLVTEHPDPLVSQDLKKAWGRGEIRLVPEKLPYGHAGSFERISREAVLSDFGARIDAEYQGAIVLSIDKLNAARHDELVARSLQKTIRHEYRHYQQWQSGEFFQKNFGDEASEVTCEEIWNREFPIYLEDCFLVEKWWPNQPSIFPPRRCAYKDDPPQFASMVFALLSGPAPDCRPVWSEIVREMQVTQSP